jgi:CheY-like chemotaxis protein
VVTSPDGLDFLTKIETEKPDIILLDLMLPEVDGFTVMENMKKNFQNSEVKDIPIIAWTNLGEDSDVRKALTSGATIYLRKSDYEGDDLVGKVRDIMMQQKAKTQ